MCSGVLDAYQGERFVLVRIATLIALIFTGTALADPPCWDDQDDYVKDPALSKPTQAFTQATSPRYAQRVWP